MPTTVASKRLRLFPVRNVHIELVPSGSAITGLWRHTPGDPIWSATPRRFHPIIDIQRVEERGAPSARFLLWIQYPGLRRTAKVGPPRPDLMPTLTPGWHACPLQGQKHFEKPLEDSFFSVTRPRAN